MKLILTYPEIGADGAIAFTICDDTLRVLNGPTTPSGWALGAGGMQKDGFLGKQDRTIQRVSGFRSAYQHLRARFNLKNSWNVTVQRGFASDEMAAAFTALHADTVPVGGELQMTLTLSGATQIFYNAGAFVANIAHIKNQEMGVDTTYAFEFDQPWTTET